MVEWPEYDQLETEPSTPERDAELQEWCLLPELALPFLILMHPMVALSL